MLAAMWPPSPLQNRVTPEGQLIATPARGTLMGNRGGCFHRADRTLESRHWRTRQWICCLLAFQGRHRRVMSPGRYTELFFLDEATALAAGHRPCFECRRADALAFADLWPAQRGGTAVARPPAPAMDRVLHAERLDLAGGKAFHSARLGELPDGTLVRAPGAYLLLGGQLQAWSPSGYGPPVAADPRTTVAVLTPPTIVAVLRSGYRPRLHDSARLGG
jgi:hypothetical protein